MKNCPKRQGETCWLLFTILFKAPPLNSKTYIWQRVRITDNDTLMQTFVSNHCLLPSKLNSSLMSFEVSHFVYPQLISHWLKQEQSIISNCTLSDFHHQDYKIENECLIKIMTCTVITSFKCIINIKTSRDKKKKKKFKPWPVQSLVFWTALILRQNIYPKVFFFKCYL